MKTKSIILAAIALIAMIAMTTLSRQPGTATLTIVVKNRQNNQVEEVIPITNRGSTIAFVEGAIIVDTWLSEPQVYPFDPIEHRLEVGVQ